MMCNVNHIIHVSLLTIMPLFKFPLRSNEKDSQGENMFMRCVSELVIESREVSDPHELSQGIKNLNTALQYLIPPLMSVSVGCVHLILIVTKVI